MVREVWVQAEWVRRGLEPIVWFNCQPSRDMRRLLADCRDFGEGRPVRAPEPPLLDPLATLASNGTSADRRFLANKMLPDPGSRCSRPKPTLVLCGARGAVAPLLRNATPRARPHRGSILNASSPSPEPRAAMRRCHRVLGPRRGRAGVGHRGTAKIVQRRRESWYLVPTTPQGPRGGWVLGSPRCRNTTQGPVFRGRPSASSLHQPFPDFLRGYCLCQRRGS